jgi:methyl-accepting chemotaxis protein
MGPKLVGAFVLATLFTLFVGIFGIMKIKASEAADTKLYTKMTVPLGSLSDMESNFQRTRVNVRDAILTGDVAKFGARAAELDKKTDDAVTEVQKNIYTEEGGVALRKMVDSMTAYRKVTARVLALVSAGKRADAEALLIGEGKVRVDEAIQNIDALQGLKLSQANLMWETNSLESGSAVKAMVIVMIIAAIIAIGIGVVIAKSITGPLQKGVEMM